MMRVMAINLLSCGDVTILNVLLSVLSFLSKSENPCYINTISTHSLSPRKWRRYKD